MKEIVNARRKLSIQKRKLSKSSTSIKTPPFSRIEAQESRGRLEKKPALTYVKIEGNSKMVFKLKSLAAYVKELGVRGLQALARTATALVEEVVLTIDADLKQNQIEETSGKLPENESKDDASDASNEENSNDAKDVSNETNDQTESGKENKTENKTESRAENKAENKTEPGAKVKSLSAKAEDKIQTVKSGKEAKDLGTEAEGKEKAKEPGKEVKSLSAKAEDKEQMKMSEHNVKDLGEKAEESGNEAKDLKAKDLDEKEDLAKIKGEDLEEVKNENEDSKKVRFACKACVQEAPKREGFKKHMQPVHDGKRSDCDQCKYRTTLGNRAYSQVRSVHERSEFHCDQCGYDTPLNCSLKKHMRPVHDEKRSNCEQCAEDAEKMIGLKTHMRSVHDQGNPRLQDATDAARMLPLDLQDTRILLNWDPGKSKLRKFKKPPVLSCHRFPAAARRPQVQGCKCQAAASTKINIDRMTLNKTLKIKLKS